MRDDDIPDTKAVPSQMREISDKSRCPVEMFLQYQRICPSNMVLSKCYIDPKYHGHRQNLVHAGEVGQEDNFNDYGQKVILVKIV